MDEPRFARGAFSLQERRSNYWNYSPDNAHGRNRTDKPATRTDYLLVNFEFQPQVCILSLLALPITHARLKSDFMSEMASAGFEPAIVLRHALLRRIYLATLATCHDGNSANRTHNFWSGVRHITIILYSLMLA